MPRILALCASVPEKFRRVSAGLVTCVVSSGIMPTKYIRGCGASGLDSGRDERVQSSAGVRGHMQAICGCRGDRRDKE